MYLLLAIAISCNAFLAGFLSAQSEFVYDNNDTPLLIMCRVLFVVNMILVYVSGTWS